MAEFDNTQALEQEEQSAINIKDIFAQCLTHWWWFVISVFVCVGLALFYVSKLPNVYSRSAQVLIKDDTKGASSAPDLSDFADFGLGVTKTNVNDEMANLSSPDVMSRVVDRLDLQTDYFTVGQWRRQTLYDADLPIKVSFPNMPNDQRCSFDVEILKGDQIKLTKFVNNLGDEIDDKDITASFGDTIMTPVGSVVVTKRISNIEPMTIDVVRSDRKSTVQAYLKNLVVDQTDDKSHVINLALTDVSAQRAEDVLGAIISVYNENWIKDKNQIAVSTSMFIKDRLGVIEDELGNVDSDISSFKSEHLLPDIGAAASMAMQQANEANTAVKDLEIQVSMARYIRNYLANDANRHQVLPVTAGIENLNMSNEIKAYNEKLMDRNSLAATSSERNPLVAELDAQLQGMRAALITAIDNQIVALNTQIRSTQGLRSAATSQIASNPKQSKYLLSVERQQKVKESLYLYLLQKREENELSQAFTAYNTRIVAEPGGSDIPTAPKRIHILLIAFILGLLLPVGIIYVREMLNTKVRGRKDLEKLTVPQIGEIPDIPHHKVDKKKLKKGEVDRNDVVVRSGSRNVINEAFRVLRANLEFMLSSNPANKVISIVSANPGSGKTFLTYNLALVLALKKKRVLIIDLDLRKASLSKYVNSPKLGISDYLVGKVNNVNDIIFASPANENVCFIPVGTIPPNPTELLYEEKLAKLIENMRDQFDYILLDCPPVEIVADAAIINKLCDMTIFIVRAGVFERSMLDEVERFYRTKKYRNMSILLNGTSAASRYGYRYGYKYGYHYGSYHSAYGSTKEED